LFSNNIGLKFNTNEAFSQFIDENKQVYFKNMSEAEWKRCTILKLVDRIRYMLDNLGYKSYNHFTNNCQTFVLDLAQPFDQYADKVKRLSTFYFSKLLFEIIPGLLGDDYRYYYECETDLGPSSLAKRYVAFECSIRPHLLIHQLFQFV
jgi:hypothetical protein